MKQFVPTVILIGALCCAVSAQDRSKVVCPVINVLSSVEAVTDGERLTFHVEVTGGNLNRSDLEYDWGVDYGRIVAGEGTPVVIVSTSGQGRPGVITANVDLSTYDCYLVARSEPVYVRRKGPRTETDSFWEWLWFRGARKGFMDSGETAVIATEIRDRLDRINPDLTVDFGAKGDSGERELIVGHKTKPSDSKEVIEFVSRAPNLVIFNIVFKNKVLHPRQ